MPDDIPSIGQLRWRVTIAARLQDAAAGGGITESLTNLLTVWADMQPVGALTYYGGVQVDTPITHRIRMAVSMNFGFFRNLRAHWDCT